jgi:hypothetical protein
MKSSNSALRPEDFPLGSLESRAAARAILEAKKTEPMTREEWGAMLVETLQQARKEEPSPPPKSAQDWLKEAESLRQCWRARLPGDKLAEVLIAACERMARFEQEDEGGGPGAVRDISCNGPCDKVAERQK